MRKIFNILSGKKRLQPIFIFLHKLSVSGMYYGGGWDTETSGEEVVLENVQSNTTAENIVVFDVGANVGSYAKLCDRALKQRAKIYSFEASPSTFTELQKELAGLQNVRSFNLAIGNKIEQSVTLYSHTELDGLASLYKRDLDHINIDMDREEHVSMTTIDSWCVENEIDHIDLLKLDIEGHELSALQGAHTMLKTGRITYIQFEFGGCNIDSKTYFKDFFQLLSPHYNIYRVVKDGLRPIDKYHELLEIFITVNYVAILKNRGASSV